MPAGSSEYEFRNFFVSPNEKGYLIATVLIVIFNDYIAISALWEDLNNAHGYYKDHPIEWQLREDIPQRTGSKKTHHKVIRVTGAVRTDMPLPNLKGDRDRSTDSS